MEETSELCRAGEWWQKADSTDYRRNPPACPLAPFLSLIFSVALMYPYFQSHSYRLWTFVYLFLIPLVTQSLSPDTSLGLRLRLCPSHQMLICYSGSMWEPENELLADNSLLCTLHQTKDRRVERRWANSREVSVTFQFKLHAQEDSSILKSCGAGYSEEP